MEAHESSDDTDDSESASFPETFGLVLTNLKKHFDPKLSPSQEDSLVDFFRKNGVTEMSGLSIFDPMILWEKRSECDLLESERLCLYLGYICYSFTIDLGVSMVVAFNWDFAVLISNCRERADYDSESEYDINNLQPSCCDTLTFFTARDWLDRIFRNAEIYKLSHSAELRKVWPKECVMAILKRFPLLAVGEYPFRGVRYCLYQPYYFFLGAGFEKGIVQEVHSYYPKVTEPVSKYRTPEMILQQMIYAGRISVDALRVALEFHPGLASARDRQDWLLLETLFREGCGEEQLELLRRLLSKDIDTFTFHMRSMGPLRVFERILPQLRELTVTLYEQELDAYVYFFKLLHSCEQTQLERLKIDLLPDLIYENEEVLEAFELFLEKLPAHLKRLTLDGNFSRRGSAIGHSSCLKSVTKGISKGSWYLEELFLRDFFFFPNDIEPLFIKNLFGSLDFQMVSERNRYAIPWVSSNKADGVRIGRLTLHQGEFHPDSWMALWQAISRATKIENVLFAPGDSRVASLPDCMLKPFEAMSMLPRLKTICICPHGGDASISITVPLVSILAHRCLEFLQVEGSFLDEEEDTYGCHAYSINTETFCQGLINNKSLQFLFLRGVKLEGTKVAKSFLDVLEEHNNTTIEFMDLCDDKHFYSIIPKAKDSWRRDLHHGFSYENYAHSWRIYYLTCFNRYGRGKVQDKSTTVDELVRLLQELHPGTGLESEEKTFYSKILKIANPVSGISTEGRLSNLYELLRSSSKAWYNVVRRDVEVLSLRYGLLRETPCLWCVGALVEGGDGSRKRKHVGEPFV